MKELRKVPPNKGVEIEYRKKLKKLLQAMSASVMYWILADYDGKTAVEMAMAIRKRVKQWDKIFGDEAEKIALWFVNKVRKHTEVGMAGAFRAVGYKMRKATPERVIKAVEIENTELIKSIPEKYFVGVKEVAMLAIVYGWSKEKLRIELQKRFDIADRRIKNIVSDQSYKTASVIKMELAKNNGIYTARWKYTYLSQEPRENHIQMDGKLFDVRVGCIEEGTGELVFPSQRINCKCSFNPVILEYGDDVSKEIEKNSYYANITRF